MAVQKKTRHQQAEETKRHIFDTALALLDSRGFESITVRDIVKEANVSIGSFYHYFSSKLDVYYETYHLADEYFDTVVKPTLAGKPLKEAILLYFDYYAKYSNEITGLALTKVLYNSQNKYFDRESETGMHKVLEDLLQQGIDRKELLSKEPACEIAQFFLTAVRGKIYNWCTNDGAYDLREGVREYVKKLLKIYL